MRRNMMKQQAATSLDKPSQIFAHAVASQDHDVQKRFPCEENTKRSLRYQRRTPTIPENLYDFILPDEWKVTLRPNPQQFLPYDNGPETKQTLVSHCLCNRKGPNSSCSYRDHLHGW